jgi:hypothetical protein
MLLSIVLWLLLALWGRAPATEATFTGYWWGHDRGLEIKPDGRGLERDNVSCCERAITLDFRILAVHGTRARAVARIRVTYSRVAQEWVAEAHRAPPHVGQVGTLVLEDGVVTEELTGATFCAPTVSACGA